MQQQRPLPQLGDNERLEVAQIRPVKFWLKYKDNPNYSMGSNQPPLIAEEWCEWYKYNVNIPVTGVDAVKRLKRLPAEWAALEPYYESWKKGGTEEVINGTPLVVWPGVKADTVEILRSFKIYSVEDLAIMSDAVMGKIPDPNLSIYRERAKKFLATKDVAEAVTELTNANAKLEALQAEMAEMRKYLAEKTLMDQERQEALEAQAPGAKLKRKVAA